MLNQHAEGRSLLRQHESSLPLSDGATNVSFDMLVKALQNPNNSHIKSSNPMDRICEYLVDWEVLSDVLFHSSRTNKDNKSSGSTDSANNNRAGSYLH